MVAVKNVQMLNGFFLMYGALYIIVISLFQLMIEMKDACRAFRIESQKI